MRFAEETKKLGYVSGRSFVVNFEVFDNRIKAGKGLSFKVQVSLKQLTLKALYIIQPRFNFKQILK